MSDSKLERRLLKFASLDEAVAESQNLLNGYTPAGSWNLSQVAWHLSDWMRFPMEGFPRPPFMVKIMLSIMRVTIGRNQLKKILADGFKPGLPTMPDSVPAPDASSDEAAVEKLAETARRLEAHTGTIHPSPFFGEITREQLIELHKLHCAHHLGFLIPTDAN